MVSVDTHYVNIEYLSSRHDVDVTLTSVLLLKFVLIKKSKMQNLYFVALFLIANWFMIYSERCSE